MNESTTISPNPVFQEKPSRFGFLKNSGIVSSLIAIGSLTLMVKLIAFGKDLLVAHQFGVSDELDAFLIAFLIPSLIPMVFAQSTPIALMPAYTQTRARHGVRAANELAIQSIRVYATGLLVIIIVTYPWIIPWAQLFGTR